MRRPPPSHAHHHHYPQRHLPPLLFPCSATPTTHLPTASSQFRSSQQSANLHASLMHLVQFRCCNDLMSSPPTLLLACAFYCCWIHRWFGTLQYVLVYRSCFFSFNYDRDSAKRGAAWSVFQGAH